MSAWLRRSVLSGASSDRNGTNSHTCTFTPATAGSLLVAVVAGPVTFSTPAGWSVVGSAVNNGGLYVFAKVATAAEDTFTTTHNGANHPILGVVYEYPAGSTIQAASSSINNLVNSPLVSPTVAGLVGPFTRFGVTGQVQTSGAAPPSTTAWTTPTIEDYDAAAPFAATDGIALSIAYDDNVPGASFAEAATLTSNVGITHERVAFALTAVPAGAGPINIHGHDAVLAGGVVTGTVRGMIGNVT